MCRVRMPIGTRESLPPRPADRTSSAAIACPEDLRRRPALHRAGRPADPPRQDREDRGADAAAQRLPGVGVHPQHRSAVPAGQHASTAPDGTVYIADMYRGIIQEGAVDAAPGSYLRAEDPAVSARQGHPSRPHLAAALRRHAGIPGHAGRTGRRRDPRRSPRSRRSRSIARSRACCDETPAQLVAHLSHPNGWWRDTAQRLLVLQAGQVGRAGAAERCARTVEQPARRGSTRCGRSRGSARSTPRSCASR